MASSPFFSVITPTYNRAQFIVSAIESVLAQTFHQFELIIVDDGSMDNTESLVAPFANKDPRVRYIKQENKGRSTARNVGIEAAKGEYICFLDSDDLWRNKHLKILQATIIQHADPALYYGGLTWWFESENREQEVEYQPRSQFESDVEFVIANEFAPDCVCVHRTILDKHKFNPQLFINEDLELWARIAAENQVLPVESNTALLRVHPGNTMTSEKDSVSPRIEVFELQLNNPQLRSQMSPAFIKNRKRRFHDLLIRQLERDNNRWALITEILKFLFRYPNQPGNKSKIVTLIYTMPGGHLLKHIVQSSKQANR